MRTTLTLDDDLAMALQEESRNTGQPFKTVLNRYLRRGMAVAPAPRAPVVVGTFDAGVREGIDVTKALDLVAEMDDEYLLAVTARLTAAAAQDDYS